MSSSQEEYDLQAFVANLAIIYMALNGRKKHGGLEGEEEGRKEGRRKPTKTMSSQPEVR